MYAHRLLEGIRMDQGWIAAHSIALQESFLPLLFLSLSTFQAMQHQSTQDNLRGQEHDTSRAGILLMLKDQKLIPESQSALMCGYLCHSS